MKYSELDESLLITSIRVLLEWNEGRRLENEAFITLYKSNEFEDVRLQIISNFKTIDNPSWYLEQLKHRFSFIEEKRLFIKLSNYIHYSTERYEKTLSKSKELEAYYKEKLEIELLKVDQQRDPKRIEFYKKGPQKGIYSDSDILIVGKNYAEANLTLVETIQRTIEELEQSLQQPAAEAEPERPPIELKNGSQKLVLMHELGVIEFLKKKYPHLTGTDLGNILGPLIGETMNHVRLGMSGYGSGVKNDPKTDSAYMAVKGKLIEYGIEI